MNFFKNKLFLAFLGLFLSGISNAMAPASRIEVAMNEGKHVLISGTDSAVVWTDELKGCVVTILNFEYTNGKSLIALSHFSHDKKSDNQRYLNTLLAHSEHELPLRHASCTIVPPGIKNSVGHLTPIIDPEWKNMIIQTLRDKIPTMVIDIQPYLFNIEESAVTYVMRGNSKKVTIVNKSKTQDIKNQSMLLICHNYKEIPLCQRILPPLLTLTALCGYLAYQMS